MSDSVRPHRQQPTRLPRPWDSPGKNTGVACHFLLQCMKVKSESEVAQLCPTLSDPMDCNLPGSSVHGILQARVLEWGAIAFSERHHQKLTKLKRQGTFLSVQSLILHAPNAGGTIQSLIRELTSLHSTGRSLKKDYQYQVLENH